MIGSLRGEILEITRAHILFEVGGIGYRVLVSPAILSALKKNEKAFFYIYDHIREDAHDLFGFLQFADLELFERLLSISGVGPKSAMTILSIGSAETIRRAIMAGDLETLTSVPGVGKKTAQKIILELKGQLVDSETQSPTDREATEALQSLGYSVQQAREALKMIPLDITNVSERVREALRMLSNR